MDYELLQRARTGDLQAFDQLYQRHKVVVWQFVLSRVGSPMTAEDIVHDTFLELIKHPSRFDPYRGVLFEAYLCAVAKKLILKHQRKRRRETLVSDQSVTPICFNQEEKPTFEQRANQKIDVQRALKNLAFNHRQVLQMVEIEGYSVKELSDQAGLSIVALKARLHRAKLALRKLLITEARFGSK
ncbi:MAG TPA: RNA polymerase sigma factor [Acidobacteriota bacterium]|nr:RNA polymerase sigma factor [Acidobacteriota bacterium]HNC44663.1 RNA polymerase sigma factor [Acidobacteriota bacterium]